MSFDPVAVIDAHMGPPYVVGDLLWWQVRDHARLPCKVVELVMDGTCCLGYRVVIEGLTEVHLRCGYNKNEFVPMMSRKLSR